MSSRERVNLLWPQQKQVAEVGAGCVARGGGSGLKCWWNSLESAGEGLGLNHSVPMLAIPTV